MGREQNICPLLSRTADPIEPFSGGRFDWSALCYNTTKTDEFKRDTLEDAARRYHQDHLRPQLPGGSPSGRK